MTIRYKFLLPAIFGFLILGATIYFIATGIFSEAIDEEVDNAHLTLQAALSREAEFMAEKALQMARVFSELPAVSEAYAMLPADGVTQENDPNAQEARMHLRRELAAYLEAYSAASNGEKLKLHFHLPNARSLVRLWREKQDIRDGRWMDISDDLKDFRNTINELNETQKPITGIELGRGGFTLRGITPIFSNTGEFLGSAEVLYSYESVLRQVLSDNHIHYALVMNQAYYPITTAFHDEKKHPFIGTSAHERFVLVASNHPTEAQKLILRTDALKKAKEKRLTFQAGRYFVSMFPVLDYSGKQIGIVTISSDQYKMLDAKAEFNYSLALITFFALALLSVTLILIGRKIARPIQEATARMEDIAQGEGDLTARIPVKSRDEIGKMAESFNRFVEKLHVRFTELTKHLGTIYALVNRNDQKAANERQDDFERIVTLQAATKRMNDVLEGIEETINERNRVEESRRLLASIVESSEDAIIATDLDGRIVSWNPGAEKMYGYTLNEVLFKNCMVLAPEEKQDEIREVIREVPEGDSLRLETLRKRKNGEVFPVSLSVSPIHSETGEMIGASIIGRDITKRKELELSAESRREQLVQADKLASLGTLAAGMAHEISNPNSFIMLNAPVIKDIWMAITPILEAHAEEHGDFKIGNMTYAACKDWAPTLLDDIEKGSERIKAIVTNLKDFARRDTASMETDVDVNEVVRSAITLTGNRLKKATDNFEVKLDEKLPAIRGNFQRIEQVVINLLINACDALEDKKKRVIIETSCDETANEVRLLVSDEGCGMSKEALRRIKDPFFTTKREKGGTGLGLSISDSIIKEHGGVLAFESTKGKGTKASVSFFVEMKKSE